MCIEHSLCERQPVVATHAGPGGHCLPARAPIQIFKSRFIRVLLPVPAPDKIKTVRGVTLHRDPAREECFTVVQLHKDLHDYDDMSDISRRQRLHRHMHNEMQTLEIVAQGLADFPDAPWELRMQLARQCWDESRHSAILYRRLREMGIRMALGARGRSVLGLLLGRAAVTAAIGVTAGGLAGVFLSRFLESYLFGVGARDPLAFAGAAIVIGGSAMLASLLPALRAARVDPNRVLRIEG